MTLPDPGLVDDPKAQTAFDRIRQQFPLGSQHLGNNSVGTARLQNEAVGAAEIEADILPWSVDIDPFLTPATQTNWGTITANQATIIKNGYVLAAAQDAEIGWDIVLGAGTWAFRTVTTTGTNLGIITVSLDGSSVGTIDLYANPGTVNVRSSITGISVASSGKKRLLLKMATKNASSSNYFATLTSVGLRRTA